MLKIKKLLICLGFVFWMASFAAAKEKPAVVVPEKQDTGKVEVYAEISDKINIMPLKPKKTTRVNGKYTYMIIHIPKYSAVDFADINKKMWGSASFTDYGNKYFAMFVKIPPTGEEFIFTPKTDVNVYAIAEDGTETLLKTYIDKEMEADTDFAAYLDKEGVKPDSMLRKNVLPGNLEMQPKTAVMGALYIDRKIAPKYKLVLYAGSDVFEVYFENKKPNRAKNKKS